MITIIFVAEDGKPVSIHFAHDHEQNKNEHYGKWFVETSRVVLNDTGWDLLQANRNNIRNLKPMMDKLHRIEQNILS